MDQILSEIAEQQYALSQAGEFYFKNSLRDKKLALARIFQVRQSILDILENLGDIGDNKMLNKLREYCTLTDPYFFCQMVYSVIYLRKTPLGGDALSRYYSICTALQLYTFWAKKTYLPPDFSPDIFKNIRQFSPTPPRDFGHVDVSYPDVIIGINEVKKGIESFIGSIESLSTKTLDERRILAIDMVALFESLHQSVWYLFHRVDREDATTSQIFCTIDQVIGYDIDGICGHATNVISAELSEHDHHFFARMAECASSLCEFCRDNRDPLKLFAAKMAHINAES